MEGPAVIGRKGAQERQQCDFA
ncbi:hypothetical protein XFF7766_1150043 [Xanthomonas citri pv. fuscans]|nr:hypothetical protein XFF7766_1150043 [Xanthomonas citri pv. fuscans]